MINTNVKAMTLSTLTVSDFSYLCYLYIANKRQTTDTINQILTQK
jgi:hypothetical protein